MDSGTLRSIRYMYYLKTFADRAEVLLGSVKEKICGVDYSVFDKTIAYYKDVKQCNISYKEALHKALDKNAHKQLWFEKSRDSIDDIMIFYQEAEIYPFRQPYLKRFGGFRWYVRLADHIKNPSVLEYGCGSAALTEWLAEKFPICKYTVADIPSTTLEFVKWKKETFGYNYNILTIGSGKVRDSFVRELRSDYLSGCA